MNKFLTVECGVISVEYQFYQGGNRERNDVNEKNGKHKAQAGAVKESIIHIEPDECDDEEE